MYLETIPEAMCDCIVSFENKKMPPVPKNPGRILAVDPGLVNFAACVTNTACRPLLIDGRQLMSANRIKGCWDSCQKDKAPRPVLRQ